MQEDKKRKVILILSILVSVAVTALIIYFMFYKNAPVNNEGSPVDDSGITASPTNNGQFPTGGSAGTEGNSGILMPTATVTATVNSRQTTTSSQVTPTATPLQVGDLDWTKKPDNNIKPPTEETILKATASNNPCKDLGLDNSWENPFEKTICGVTDYLIDNILDPLLSFGCSTSASALNVNYGSNITAKYINGQCFVEDR